MIKNILFDFDGVILDSMPVRDFGFREIFKNFDQELVEKLIEYNNLNGGLSRYVKIRYFYEELLEKTISEEKVQELAQKFSEIMRKELPNKKYMIKETIKFIEENHKKYNLHIVSGSDGEELRYLCKELEIDKFFLSINGSPTPKNELVAHVLKENNYLENETILIGDSINDYEAAKANNIDFYGFNNKKLINYSKIYIDTFDNIMFLDYGIGENSTSKENKTFYKTQDSKKIDYLIYLDSRGLTINEEDYYNSYMYKLIKELESKDRSYIAISRPKNLMTFATLLNFLNSNPNLSFKNLITNIGFVDFTPKKKIFIEDMILQANTLWDGSFEVEELSIYKMINGEEKLYTLKYSLEYAEFISEYILNYKLEKCIFINTPIVSSNIKIERKRPIEFFEKIIETNAFITKLCKSSENFISMDIGDKFLNDEEIFTYDAVHYTINGHEMILDKLLKILSKRKDINAQSVR